MKLVQTTPPKLVRTQSKLLLFEANRISHKNLLHETNPLSENPLCGTEAFAKLCNECLSGLEIGEILESEQLKRGPLFFTKASYATVNPLFTPTKPDSSSLYTASDALNPARSATLRVLS